MDDETAYMELVRSNAQSELSALERGMHALHSGLDGRSYAASVGRAERSVYNELQAAKVADAVAHVGNDQTGQFRALVEIHAAPRWLWPALVEHLLAETATVDAMRRVVASSIQRTRDTTELRIQLGADVGQHRDDDHADKAGDQAVLDGGCAGLVV